MAGFTSRNMVASMPMRTGPAGSCATAGTVRVASPNTRGISAVVSRVSRIGEPLGSGRDLGWEESGRGHTDRGRRGHDAGVEPAGGNPFEVGQGQDLMVERLVVSRLRLPGHHVGLKDVFLLD